MTEKRSMEHCLMYTGEPKCHYTGEFCDDDYAQICEDYHSDEELSAMKSNGLKVLEFYEYKLKNADKKEFDNAREELWIVKEVLSEMGVIKDE